MVSSGSLGQGAKAAKDTVKDKVEDVQEAWETSQVTIYGGGLFSVVLTDLCPRDSFCLHLVPGSSKITFFFTLCSSKNRYFCTFCTPKNIDTSVHFVAQESLPSAFMPTGRRRMCVTFLCLYVHSTKHGTFLLYERSSGGFIRDVGDTLRC